MLTIPVFCSKLGPRARCEEGKFETDRDIAQLRWMLRYAQTLMLETRDCRWFQTEVVIIGYQDVSGPG